MATRQKWDSQTERMVRGIDALAEYEEFCDALLPKLRRMVLENWPAERIRKEVAPYIAARMVTIALTGPSSSPTTIKACQDTLDRVEGKPVQRQETLHRYAQMGKAELAALALQKLKDAGIVIEAAPQPRQAVPTSDGPADSERETLLPSNSSTSGNRR